MADKKITALTALTAAGKVAANDLLHIIDYSASPVNKKISVAHLFEKVNCVISSYGAFTHDFGASAAASGLSVVVPNATPAAGAETVVAVNDDGNAFVDFKVETGLSASALYVDSSLDTDNGSCNTVTINGDFAKVDFRVNSDTSTATTPLIHCDSTDHAIGIGKEDPDTAYLMDFAAVSGKSIKAAGGIDVTGVSSITGATTITGAATVTGSTTVGITASGTLALSSVESVTTDGAGDDLSIAVTTSLVTTTSSSGAGALPDGTTVGQIKIISCVVRGGSGNDYVLTPANFKNGSTITFDAVGDCVTLIWQTGGWAVAGGYGITLG